MKNITVILLGLMVFGCVQKREITDVKISFPNDQFRPLLHFSPQANWMNDPNGMVFFKGEYHLFYQYYPDSTVWGPMHWGHAVSTDLLHWEELPIALYPDELGYIFSGSAVIDWKNTSGLQNGEHPPMIAIFTHHDPKGEKEEGNVTFQYQSIAHSNDKGRTWTKYEDNPVIPNPGIRDFRDPKVFWHDQTQKWIMIFAAADKVKLYSSPNLIDWKFESDFGANHGSHGGVWECPDLFKLKVEGSEKEKWVMIVSIGSGGPNGGSATQYFVGDFDGKEFSSVHYPERIQWLDYGRDNYASVTWSNIPEEDGRRLFIGWMSNWQYAQVVPTENWRSAMTLPRSLHLLFDDRLGVYKIASRPVEELERLKVKKNAFTSSHNLQEGKLLLDDFGKEAGSMPFYFEWTVDLEKSTSPDYGFKFENPETGDLYTFSIEDGKAYSDRTQAGLTNFEERFATEKHAIPLGGLLDSKKLKFEVYVDTSSIEVFINDGELTLTDIFFPKDGFSEAYFYSEEGELTFDYTSTPLQSIW